MRIDLGDGDWAELRHANKIPHGRTLEYRDVFFRVVEGSADAEQIDDLSEKEIAKLSPDEKSERDKKQRANAKVIIESGGLRTMEDLSNALVLAVVKDWSFGEVNLGDAPRSPDRRPRCHLGALRRRRVPQGADSRLRRQDQSGRR